MIAPTTANSKTQLTITPFERKVMSLDCMQSRTTATGGDIDDCSLSSSATLLISNRIKVTPDNKDRMETNVSHNDSEKDVDTLAFSRDPSGRADPNVFANDEAAGNEEAAAAGNQNHPPVLQVNNPLGGDQQGSEHGNFSELTTSDDNDLEGMTEEEKAEVEAAEAAAKAAKEVAEAAAKAAKEVKREVKAKVRKVKAKIRRRKMIQNMKLAQKKTRPDDDDQDKDNNGPIGVAGGEAVAT
jgi:hypothetical protein